MATDAIPAVTNSQARRSDLTDVKELPIMSEPDPEGIQPEETRKEIPMETLTEVAPTTKPRWRTELRDKECWEQYEVLKTWSAVAKEMGYANGSVARRAGYRYAYGTGLVVDSAPTPKGS